MAIYPTHTDITNFHLDQTTDKPKQARLELVNSINKFKQLIGAIDFNEGVCGLDANGKIITERVEGRVTATLADNTVIQNENIFDANNTDKGVTMGNIAYGNLTVNKLSGLSTDNTLGGDTPSQTLIPTQKACKEFIDTKQQTQPRLSAVFSTGLYTKTVEDGIPYNDSRRYTAIPFTSVTTDNSDVFSLQPIPSTSRFNQASSSYINETVACRINQSGFYAWKAILLKGDHISFSNINDYNSTILFTEYDRNTIGSRVESEDMAMASILPDEVLYINKTAPALRLGTANNTDSVRGGILWANTGDQFFIVQFNKITNAKFDLHFEKIAD